MPCLSGRYDPAIGPLVNIGVLPPGVLTPALPASLQIPTYPALIDTGASSTCIAPAIAQILNLQPLGMRPVVSATQSVPMNVYLVDLVLPFGQTLHVLTGMQVYEFASAGTNPFQVLLGRDIICQGTLNLSFDRHFVFCL